MRARSILRRISSLCNGACQGSGASLANSAISSAWGSLDCSNALRRFRAAGLGWRSFQTRRSCIATPLQHSYVTHRALMAAARQFSSGGESIVKISPAAAARLRELQKVCRLIRVAQRSTMCLCFGILTYNSFFETGMRCDWCACEIVAPENRRDSVRMTLLLHTGNAR